MAERDGDRERKDRVPDAPAAEGGGPELPEGSLEDEDHYPLRDPSEDARWAVRSVKVWVGIELFLLAFILVLLALGMFHP